MNPDNLRVMSSGSSLLNVVDASTSKTLCGIQARAYWTDVTDPDEASWRSQGDRRYKHCLLCDRQLRHLIDSVAGALLADLKATERMLHGEIERVRRSER